MEHEHKWREAHKSKTAENPKAKSFCITCDITSNKKMHKDKNERVEEGKNKKPKKNG